MPAAADLTCCTGRCIRLEEALQKWEHRLVALEEKMDALPDTLCQAMESRPLPSSAVQHVHQALQKALQVFADAITVPDSSNLSRPSISPLPSEPVVVVRSIVQPSSPPPLHRTSSFHKASIANLMSSANVSLPTSPVDSTPSLSPQPPMTYHIPSPLASSSYCTPPQTCYDQPRVASSVQFTLNASIDDELHEQHCRVKQSPPPSPPRPSSQQPSHSFICPIPSTTLLPRASSPSTHAISMPNAPRRSSWHPPNAHLSPPLPIFHWSDGTRRHAPEAWEFPSTTCRAMWQLWFLGDSAVGIGPFRHLSSWDIERFAKDTTSRKQLSRARTVMNKLVDIAVDQSLVSSADDLEGAVSAAGLDAVFDRAFEILLHTNPGDLLQGAAGHGTKHLRADKAWTYTYSSVHTFMAPTSRKRKLAHPTSSSLVPSSPDP
ncbi:hypothetical protein B5M09_002113 [Aphanomyces astaci]|uniref:Uncharacterized protein n=1 Tax=Aphanomyces astaci TaxID=112090 RepID=A0A425DN16_APHAT|nr:hypothetical protein B5M09_002113 [Aphanomyces astaci]